MMTDPRLVQTRPCSKTTLFNMFKFHTEISYFLLNTFYLQNYEKTTLLIVQSISAKKKKLVDCSLCAKNTKISTNDRYHVQSTGLKSIDCQSKMAAKIPRWSPRNSFFLTFLLHDFQKVIRFNEQKNDCNVLNPEPVEKKSGQSNNF